MTAKTARERLLWVVTYDRVRRGDYRDARWLDHAAGWLAHAENLRDAISGDYCTQPR